MSNSRRQFSVEQKLAIMQEADQTGIAQTLRKHNLSHSVFLRWKRQFNSLADRHCFNLSIIK
jgi:putative transposase